MKTRTKRRRQKLVTSKRANCTSYGKLYPDPLFYASSGMMYTTTPGYKDYITEDGAIKMFKYGASLRSKNVNAALFYGDEQITSVRGHVGRKGYNNCLHRKLQTVNKPYLLMSEYSLLATKLFYTRFYRALTTRPYPTTLTDVASVHGLMAVPGMDKLFSARAFWSMRPKFVGEVSLVNSLFELKDFKDVVNLKRQFKNWNILNKSDSVSAAMREFKKLKREHNTAITINREHSVKAPYDMSFQTLKTLARDVSGAAANAVLTINLAIKPTIMDVMAIRAAMLTTANEAQKTFAEFGEPGSSSHYSEQDIYSDLVNTGGAESYYRFEGRQTVVKKTASMRATYDYKMRTANQALIKYWGLSGTAEALWNMLPLSFVLDYVYTVGKALQFMYRDENVTMLTTEYCESTKVTVTDGLHFTLTPRVHSFVLDGKYYKRQSRRESLLVSGAECTRYSRMVCDPYKGPALPRFKKPSISQAENILALCRSFLS